MSLGSSLTVSLPAVPALLGLVVSVLVALLTKTSAPAAVKRTVAVLLSLLAGAASTVAYNPHAPLGTYAGAVLAAWVVAVVTHTSGVLAALESATGNAGIGPSVADVPAGGTPMGAHVQLTPQGTLETVPATPAAPPAA